MRGALPKPAPTTTSEKITLACATPVAAQPRRSEQRLLNDCFPTGVRVVAGTKKSRGGADFRGRKIPSCQRTLDSPKTNQEPGGQPSRLAPDSWILSSVFCLLSSSD